MILGEFVDWSTIQLPPLQSGIIKLPVNKQHSWRGLSNPNYMLPSHFIIKPADDYMAFEDLSHLTELHMSARFESAVALKNKLNQIDGEQRYDKLMIQDSCGKTVLHHAPSNSAEHV